MPLRVLILCFLSGTLWAADQLPFWTPPTTASALEAEGRAAVASAKGARDRLLAVSDERTVENTLVPFDEIRRLASLVPAGLVQNTHPDAATRSVAEKIVRDIGALQSEILLDPGIYKALSALETKQGLDAETHYYLQKTLQQFRDAGVDKSEEVRTQITAARNEIVRLQQDFQRNITEGLARIKFRVSDLDGVPEDYLRSHKPDAEGNILVSNDREDIEPITFYCRNAESRRRASVFFSNRGYPANMQILTRLFEARHRLAALSGFPDFVEMNMRDRMVASEAGQREFLKQVDLASSDAARAQEKLLLAAKRKENPEATTLEYSDVQYYIQKVRDERYHFNEQDARPYFPYVRVKDSVLSSAAKMFGIEFRSVHVAVWHPSVEAYDVIENGVIIGRIYLDMFPRPNKYQHFATFSMRPGVLGKQLPEGTLVCNFAEPTESDPGLMTPSMATTFFHEFGHLLHAIFSGHAKWAGLARPESDFMEAPSQLLEEWYRNPRVLRSFARHYQTGEPIPEDMVNRMVEAEHFGDAVLTRRQLFLANLSLEYDAGDGKPDLDRMVRDLYGKFVGLEFPADMHLEAAFTHLGNPGYAGAYYTYQWSLAIAKDMFTKFDGGDLLDAGPARKYREAILNPGGSAPAAKLVENFLGRPFNLKAYQTWLQSE